MLDTIFLSNQRESFKNFQNKIFNTTSVNKTPLFEKFLHEFFKYIPLDYISEDNVNPFHDFAQEAFDLAFKKQKIKVNYQNNRLSICTINTDKPFIVDSIKCLLKKFDLEISFIFHPVINVTRNAQGELDNIFTEKCKDCLTESVVYVELYAYITDEKVQTLEQELQKVLEDVETTFHAWPQIAQELDGLLEQKLPNNSTKFLKWLKEDNFTFLGFIKVSLEDTKILTQIGNNTAIAAAKDYMDNFVANSKLHDIVIGNLDKISTVHKAKLIDYLLLVHDKNVYVILGLYRSNIHYQSSEHIPILADKLNTLLSSSGFVVGGYNYKKLKIIFESLPREMLLQLSDSDLRSIAFQILSSMMSKNLKVFVFADMLSNFAHFLIFLSRDQLSPEVQQSIKQYLTNKLSANLASDDFDEITKNFCYLYNILEYKNINSINIQDLEQDLLKIVTSWKSELKINLIKQFGTTHGGKLYMEFADVFPKDYQHKCSIQEALQDIDHIQKCLIAPVFKVSKDNSVYWLKIFDSQSSFTLSEILPILENLGFKVIQEQSFSLRNKIIIQKFLLESSQNNINVEVTNVENILEQILVKKSASSTLHKLVTLANLNSREITILKALTRYLHQSGFSYDKNYVQTVLIKHYEVTLNLVKLFEARFDIKLHSNELQISLIEQINKYIEGVQNSSEDKVLKYMLGIVLAIVRTNAYQLNQGDYKPYLSFKFDSSKVPGLPLPLPYAEIYVYAEEFEGIHLRAGKVARGGLRWSDRGEDYRTEALGLMKAQNTKNSVIVPLGSKGAFFIRNLDKFQGAILNNYVVECYKNFLRGLLDLTDNIIGGLIKHPENAVIYDEQDPYLVVAADKGTATFSDYANQISAEYNFWLGDAFASGGSAGYDHKKIGITARGAWVSTIDHLRNLNINFEDARFIGIGDMSGDVFGNGMLLSDKIKLVAAFDHRHIFIDPNPCNSIASYNERKRLFNTLRSKWSDYNPELISEGGAIFERSAKNITLSKQIQKMLNVKKHVLSPEELIRALLTSEVDVIWNGGIGTYVKSSLESNEQIGDKTNDLLRVNGKDIKAKAIVEGGNLGLSQKGRIEFALGGGKVNTDFIDNSAGVDCSDHEVNIKICLASSIASNKISTEKRNTLLSEMTDEVAQLVLLDNLAQTQAITIRETSSMFNIEMFSELIDFLEQDGLLNREVEFLPTKEEINRRIINNLPLTRPEISVLVSYSKMFIYNNIIKSTIFEDSYFKNKILPSYFPKIMQENFINEIKSHQLQKEIIGTIAANKIINQLSGPIAIGIIQDLDTNAANLVKAYFIVNEVFDVDDLWTQIENANLNQSNKTKAFTSIIKLIRRSISWILKHYQVQHLSIERVYLEYKTQIMELINSIDKFLSTELLVSLDKVKSEYIASGMGESLADKISKIEYAVSALDVLYVSNALDKSKYKLAKLYFKIGSRLKFDALRSKCDEIMASATYLNKLSAQTLKADFYNKQRLFTHEITKITDNNLINFTSWYKSHRSNIISMLRFINSLIFLEKVDINALILANHKIQNLMEKIKINQKTS